MSRRLLGLLRKELLQVLRDPVVLGLILFLYTVETINCTRALTFEIERLPIGIVDQDRSVASRHLTDLFALAEAFDLKRQSETPAVAEAWLETGDASVVLVIPTGFERYYQTGIEPSVQASIARRASATEGYAWRRSGGWFIARMM